MQIEHTTATLEYSGQKANNMTALLTSRVEVNDVSTKAAPAVPESHTEKVGGFLYLSTLLGIAFK